MIKIAFVINTIYSPTGGTEKQLLLLIKHLDRRRFAPVLCVVHSSPLLEQEFDLCPLYTIGVHSYKNPSFLMAFWRFVRFLETKKFDIVQTLFQDGMRIGIPAARLAGVRTIIAVRRNQGYWMKTFDLTVTKILNRWVDLIIANSHNTRQWAAKTEGFPVDRIGVIHNGIDLDSFQLIPPGTRAEYRTLLGIPENAPAVGIVANLRPVKSLDVFICAASLVKLAFPTAHFIVVGEGDLEEDLKQQAKDLNLDDSVHFLGRRTDIAQILATLDVGVLTSSSESFSNTIVEYLAMGLPVVCTDVGGAREAVVDNVNGFVVPIGDSQLMAERIGMILNNNEIKVTMGRLNKIKAEEYYQISGMVAKHESIYSDNVRTCLEVINS